MPATPRAQLIDKDLPMRYHLVSGCVRQALLCGDDKHNRKKYDHPKHLDRRKIVSSGKLPLLTNELTLFRSVCRLRVRAHSFFANDGGIKGQDNPPGGQLSSIIDELTEHLWDIA